jgi:hypothetical protein
LQKISAAMGEERKTARKKKAGAWRTAKNADAPDQRFIAEANQDAVDGPV